MVSIRKKTFIGVFPTPPLSPEPIKKPIKYPKMAQKRTSNKALYRKI